MPMVTPTKARTSKATNMAKVYHHGPIAFTEETLNLTKCRAKVYAPGVMVAITKVNGQLILMVVQEYSP